MKPKGLAKERTGNVRFTMQLRNREVSRRILFGVPDPKKTDEWLEERAQERAQKAKERWQFDFEKERPCSSAENDGNEAIQYDAVPEDQVPAFYRSRPAKDPAPLHLESPSKRKRGRSLSVESSEIKSSNAQLLKQSACKSPRKIQLAKNFRVNKEDHYTTPKKARH